MFAQDVPAQLLRQPPASLWSGPTSIADPSNASSLKRPTSVQKRAVCLSYIWRRASARLAPLMNPAPVCLDCTATRAAARLDLDIRLAPGCPVKTLLFSGRERYQLADANVPRVTGEKQCVLSENVRGRCTSSSAAVALMVQARTCPRGTLFLFTRLWCPVFGRLLLQVWWTCRLAAENQGT